MSDEYPNIKIKQIIEENGITASRFADEVGIPRPVISHILAGRNRPSLDVIIKITQWNPSYTLDYFVAPHFKEDNKASQIVENKQINARKEDNFRLSEFNRNFQPTNPPIQSNEATKKTTTSNEVSKQVERILIFYSDNTFSEYRPA